MKNYLYHIARPGMTVREGYIGVSVEPEVRFAKHKGSEYRVGRAIRKYDDVTMTILMESSAARCYATEKVLRPEENIGWNMAIGGGKPPGMKGLVHTDETRAKMSKAQKGKVFSAEVRENMSKAQMGRVFSAEHRAKMSKAQMGRVMSAETRAKLSDAKMKLSNVYLAETDELVAEGVSLMAYAAEHGLHRSGLSHTALGVRHTSQGFYARLQCECGQPIEYIWKARNVNPRRAEYDAEMALAYEVK